MRGIKRNRQNLPMNHQAVENLDQGTVFQFLLNHIKNFNLHRYAKTKGSAPDMTFTSNQDFWKSILKTTPPALKWVRLMRFQIVDWFPRAPGLYHTSEATFERENAEKYLHEENGIYFYDPSGKTHMINGGIGSVRFKPISISGQEYWLCTATSDGRCHTGIPLAISSELMEHFDFKFGYPFKITGQIKYLPEFLEPHFYHWHHIPQLYLVVESIEIAGKDGVGEIEITPMVFFTGEIEELRSRSKENVTYVRCSHGELDRAAEWITQYVSRYSGNIITNYDQQRPMFKDAPFSLQNIMKGRLDEKILKKYTDHVNSILNEFNTIHAETMTKIEVQVGDGATINGNLVVAKSIENSFNKVASADIADNLKDLLEELTKQVKIIIPFLSKEEGKQVVQDLEVLTAEAISKNPRKQWWQISLDELKKTATTIGEIGKPILEIADRILPFLSGQ